VRRHGLTDSPLILYVLSHQIAKKKTNLTCNNADFLMDPEKKRKHKVMHIGMLARTEFVNTIGHPLTDVFSFPGALFSNHDYTIIGFLLTSFL
jgi:hypothetical protein